MWQPNRRQWLVLWIAAPAAWLAWALPGTEAFVEVLDRAWVLVVAVAALLVWRFQDAAPPARGAKAREAPLPGPGRLFGWLLVIGLLAALLLRLSDIQDALGGLLQPADLNAIQTSLQDIADKLSR